MEHKPIAEPSKPPLSEEKRLRTLSNGNIIGELRGHKRHENHLRSIYASVLLTVMGAPVKENDPYRLVHPKPPKKTRMRKTI